MNMKEEQGETRIRHIAYTYRKVLRGSTGLTSPSDGQITINSDIPSQHSHCGGTWDLTQVKFDVDQ